MTAESVASLVKSTSPQILAVVAGTLAAISDGMQYAWTAPVIPILLGPDSPVETTKDQSDWLETIFMMGAFSGLATTIYFVDKIGRKKSLLLSSFVTLLVWIVIAVAPRIEYIYVARFFGGMAGDMAFVAAPMYIAEIADQRIRGFLSSIIYLMMLIGVMLIYSIAPYVPIYAHCILGGGLVLLELIVFPFMPESPYYLLYIDKPEEAKKSLQIMRPEQNVEKELLEIKAAVERQKTERGKPQDLILVRSNRKSILIMAILNWAQHFSSISVLFMNLHVILEAAGSVYIDNSIAAIIFSVVMFVSAVSASLTIDRFGRKTLLIISSILTGICVLIIAVYFNLKNLQYDVDAISWIPVVSVMLYACVFKLGLGMVPIVLTAELFPAKMKAIGMTLADAMYVTSSLLSILLYQKLSESLGMEYPFYIFSVCCFFAALFTYLFIPETKGKTLEEIQLMLKGHDGPGKPLEEEA